MYAPAAVTWIVNLIYQQPSVVFTSLNQFWGIPDNMAALINQSVLYRAMRYIRSASADNEYKILQSLIQKQRGSDQAEQSNVFLEPIESLIDYGPSWAGGGGGF
jgi:hypothetical protein